MSGNRIFTDVVESLRDVFYTHYYLINKDQADRFILEKRGKSDDPYQLMITGFKNRDRKLCLNGFLDMISSIMSLYQ